jgi:hypothetical protein
MKRYPKPMGHPPKLRSFVDHWPHNVDMFRNKPLAVTYVDHFPQAGDMLPNVKDEATSYVDHFAHSGDLVKQ